MTARRALPYAGFAGLAILVNVLGYFAVHSTAPNADYLKLGVFLDCAITIPLGYWLLLVRPGLRTRQSLAVIACLSVLRGAYTLSSQAGSTIAICAEAALFLLLVFGRKSLVDSIPGLSLLRAELAVLRYAFGRLKPDVPFASKAFTIHENSGGALLFFVVAGLTPVEAGVLHLILPKPLSWVMLALSLYSALWLIAIGRSFAALPILVDAEGITLRKGLLASIRIPKSAIRSVSRTQTSIKVLKFALFAEPSIFIEFNQPLTAQLPLGLTKTAMAASIAPDNPAAFMSALES